VPATYGAAELPASWRIESRSSGAAKITSVETVKLGRRTEWTRLPPTSSPRAGWVAGTSTAGRRTSPSRSASSRDVPLGASGFAALA